MIRRTGLAAWLRQIRRSRHFVGLAPAMLLLLAPGATPRAADPLPYEVSLGTTGDAALDKTLHDSSTLISLSKTAPVGPFALAARARDDAGRFAEALHSFGYYQAQVDLTIAGHRLDEPGLIDALEALPAAQDGTAPDRTAQAGTAQSGTAQSGAAQTGTAQSGAAQTGAAKVVAQFKLGPLFHLGAVTVTGSMPPEVSADAPAELGIHTGDPARAADVLAAGAHLRTTLRQAGYAMATVQPPVAILHPADHTLDVSYAVDTGPRVDLGAISITGLKDVHEAYVRNRLTLHPGQRYDPAAIQAARDDLAGLGVFSDVRVETGTKLDAEGRLPVTFAVTERPRHLVDLGLAYSTDLGLTPSIGWHDRNLFGNGEQLNLTASASDGGSADNGLGYKVGAQFIKPDFLARDQSLQVEVDALRQDFEAYDQDALLESVTITRPLWPHWTGSVGLSAEQEYIVQEDVGRDYNLIGVPLGLKFDNSDNKLEPTKGIRLSLSVTPMQSLSAHRATFTTMQASASTYFDLTGNGRSVLAVRGLIGQISGAGPFSLPPDQRFYAGGSTTVRGFRYQSVGPQFPDGNPTGGTSISAGSIELRQHLWGNWGAAAFVDAGEVTGHGAALETGSGSGVWRIGAGVGARYYTSIGPIRLDVAVPVNRAPGGDSFEFYIGLGEAF